MARLVFASIVTFGILIGMVAGLVLAAMVVAGEVNFTIAIALIVVINLVIWLISPWLSDLTLRWFNSLEFLDDAAVKQRYPGIHHLIHQVADDYRFSAPRIGFIPDRNPSALVKIAYGIVAVEDAEATQSLLRSARHLGVIDVKNAHYTGLLAESAVASPG